MKHSLIATSLFALWYGVGALAAPPEPSSGSGTAVGGPESAAEPGPGAQGAGAATGPESDSGGGAVQSDVDKINYSLGFELGEDLKRDNLEAVPEVLMKGVTDALSGAKPQFKPSERRKALLDIKNKRAQENLERSQAFLAENAKKEGVTSLESGLQYKELRAGEGKTPALDSRVTVNYRGTLVDGSEFDSSYQRGKPSQFDVKRVIKGWREALLLMKEGAKWELYIPPDLAYGKSSPNKRIPPNSALIFEVELLSVAAAPPRSRQGLVPPKARDLDED